METVSIRFKQPFPQGEVNRSKHCLKVFYVNFSRGMLQS